MRDLLNQIQMALNLNLYYLALFVSLSIPDVCGAIESENGKAKKSRYINWFDKYVSHKYGDILTGEDCYYFRCSLLHRGSSQHQKSTFSRVLFIEPLLTTNIIHSSIANDALIIDVRIFCTDIIEGVLDWLRQNEGTELYERNYDKFMRRYPQGLSPYIKGVPVIS